VFPTGLQGKHRRIESHHREAGAIESFGKQSSSRPEIEHTVDTVTKLATEHPDNERNADRSEQDPEGMEKT